MVKLYQELVLGSMAYLEFLRSMASGAKASKRQTVRACAHCACCGFGSGGVLPRLGPRTQQRQHAHTYMYVCACVYKQHSNTCDRRLHHGRCRRHGRRATHLPLTNALPPPPSSFPRAAAVYPAQVDADGTVMEADGDDDMSSSSGEDGDGDGDGDDAMDEGGPPQAVPLAGAGGRQPQAPVVDEDGFTMVVQKGGRGRRAAGGR